MRTKLMIVGALAACLAAACATPNAEQEKKQKSAILQGCAYGEGWYCGGTVGQTVGALYYCQNDQFSLVEECTDTCIITAPGEADYCGTPSGGGGGGGAGGGGAAGGGGSGGGGSLLEAARKYEGTPYVLGGPEMCVPYEMMDCSCLTSTAAYEGLGMDLPDDPVAQLDYGTAVDFYDLQVGDLVFFDETGGGFPTHVGIYSGNGMIYHSNSYTYTATEGEMKYIEGYMGARRL